MLQNTINCKKENPQTLKEMLYLVVYPLSHWGKICNLFRAEECLNLRFTSAPKARIFSCWRMPGNRCWCQGGSRVNRSWKGTKAEGHTPWVVSSMEMGTAKASSCPADFKLFQDVSWGRWFRHDLATTTKRLFASCYLLFPQQQLSHNNHLTPSWSFFLSSGAGLGDKAREYRSNPSILSPERETKFFLSLFQVLPDEELRPESCSLGPVGPMIEHQESRF